MKTVKKYAGIVAILVMILTAATLLGSVKVKAADAGTETTGEAAEADENEDAGGEATKGKALGAGIAVGLAAAAGAIGMGIAIAKSNESVARQPEAEGPIRSTLMLGLVFIETVVIYALIVAILIVFVM